ncbi:protein of unknown function DUF1326 [Thermobaculum terrenum ATCC BAA-798]|uniref:DUF1326 domain-containing protein n=2 Tax=Thermobaculum TaxID=262406 RepID=D1CGL5_THET1|nr:protein of unknown function DUF1326 [Thermobaculum terrenum ATCC BAA-798]
MAWHISGTYYAPCSCKVGCPCTLGEPDGDQGWCSGAILLDIQSGEVDGTDVSGSRALFLADWPRGFISGNGTARIYFDSSISAEKRSALEPMLMGKMGGVLEVLASLVPNMLAPKDAPIQIQTIDGKTQATVGDVGMVVVEPLVGPNGEPTVLQNGAFAFRGHITLGRGTGTYFHDPEMRAWTSAGHGEMEEFDWSA